MRAYVLTAIGTAAEQAHYQRFSYDKNLVNQLKSFGHGKHESPPRLEAVDLEYVNLRSHKRYLYKTNTQVETQEGQQYFGHSRDFSVMGLQIEYDRPVTLQQGDIVELNLPELQEITQKHNLTGMKYEVVAVSKSLTTINLKAYRMADTPHEGVKFFTQLIENNKDKLKASQEAPKIPGLSTALRNMVTKSVCQFPFYLHKDAAHFKTDAIGQGLYPSPLHTILQSYGLLNNATSIDAFLSPAQISEVIAPLLKDRSRQDPPLPFTLFIRFDPKKSTIEKAVKSQCTASDDYTPQKLFLKKGIKAELVFVIRLFISRTGRPDTDYLANELKYVSQYALHKAKHLEEALWSVSGVGDMVDVTEETLSHFELATEQVEQMHKRKQIWLKRLT